MEGGWWYWLGIIFRDRHCGMAQNACWIIMVFLISNFSCLWILLLIPLQGYVEGSLKRGDGRHCAVTDLCLMEMWPVGAWGNNMSLESVPFSYQLRHKPSGNISNSAGLSLCGAEVYLLWTLRYLTVLSIANARMTEEWMYSFGGMIIDRGIEQLGGRTVAVPLTPRYGLSG
jgi:hypothetical protein